MKRIVAWACLICLYSICLMLAISLNNLLDGICGNAVIREVLSPDHRIKAVIFQRNCGATTSFSTQVSLLPAQGTLPNHSGNIFVTDDINDISVRWLSVTQLKIIYDRHTRTFNKQVLYRTPYRDVSITYQAR
jgi:hypothetical protein